MARSGSNQARKAHPRLAHRRPHRCETVREADRVGLGIALPFRKAAFVPAGIEVIAVERQLERGDVGGEFDEPFFGGLVEGKDPVHPGLHRHEGHGRMILRREMLKHEPTEVILSVDPVAVVVHDEDGRQPHFLAGRETETRAFQAGGDAHACRWPEVRTTPSNPRSSRSPR